MAKSSDKPNNIVFIISLGQLTNSTIKDSIGSFADLWAEKTGVFQALTYPFCWLGSAAFYCYDRVISNQIERFKKGELTKNEFRNYLRGFYGPESDDKIDAAWNKLCQIEDAAITRVRSACAALSEHSNAKLLVISATNEINADYIINTISAKVPAFNAQNNQIEFVFSYQHQTTSLTQLSTSALSKYTEHRIVSLHRDIAQAATINIDTRVFKCRPFNPSTGEDLGQVMKHEMSI